MMKASDIYSQVRNIAGDTDALQFADTDLVRWINNGARECAIDNNLLQKKATQNTVINQTAYLLPVDILKLHSVKVGGEKIPIVSFEEADSRGFDPDSPAGRPQYGYIWAGNLEILPKPSMAYTLEVYYTRTPVDVVDGTSNIDLPEAYQVRLVDYCLAQVAQQDDDMNRYAMKMEEFRTGVQNLKDQPEWENNLYPFIHYAEATEWLDG